MSRNYSWLLFDADDTLFDYGAAERGAVAATFEQFRLPFNSRILERYREINHGLWLQFERGEISGAAIRSKRFELLFSDNQLLADSPLGKLPPDLSEAYLVQLGAQVILNPGAQEMLDTLAPRYRIAIITNGLSLVQRARLAQSSIRHHIAEIIVSEEVGHAKPAPEIFNIALKQMGNVKPEQVLIIGDSLTSDMAGGIASGIDTCWYNPNHLERPPSLPITHEIHHWSELIAWLDMPTD